MDIGNYVGQTWRDRDWQDGSKVGESRDICDTIYNKNFIFLKKKTKIYPFRNSIGIY